MFHRFKSFQVIFSFNQAIIHLQMGTFTLKYFFKKAIWEKKTTWASVAVMAYLGEPALPTIDFFDHRILFLIYVVQNLFYSIQINALILVSEFLLNEDNLSSRLFSVIFLSAFLLRLSFFREFFFVLVIRYVKIASVVQFLKPHYLFIHNILLYFLDRQMIQ